MSYTVTSYTRSFMESTLRPRKALSKTCTKHRVKQSTAILLPHLDSTATVTEQPFLLPTKASILDAGRASFRSAHSSHTPQVYSCRTLNLMMAWIMGLKWIVS